MIRWQADGVRIGYCPMEDDLAVVERAFADGALGGVGVDAGAGVGYDVGGDGGTGADAGAGTVDVDVIVARTDPEDVARVQALRKREFVFHNRTVLGTVSLKALSGPLFERARSQVEVDTRVDQAVYGLAYTAFPKDRRFHLKADFDQDFANAVLKSYIDHYSQQDVLVFRSMYKDELAGFTIVQLKEGGACENVLGAVSPLYQGRGIAIGLYTGMLKHLQNLGMKELSGRISTTNMASINLHIALGAKYSHPEDDYIWWV